MSRPRAIAILPVALVLAAALAPACFKRPQFVHSHDFGLEPGHLSRVAVLPFEAPDPKSGALIERLVGEALAARGVDFVAAPDVARAMRRPSDDSGPVDLVAASDLVARSFGATSALSGVVTRYRERVGSDRGARVPASVGFRLTLRTAPGGSRLWLGDFDHTQHPLSERPFQAARLPGGGTRWLSAEELARFGVEQTVAALPESP